MAVSSHITFQRAAPTDFPAIIALLESCGLYTSSVTPAGSTYWLARVGSVLGNVLGGCIGLEHGVGASLIRSTAVLPQFRGQALGRALVQQALAEATRRGDHTVYLFSSDAGEFWQHLGFVPSRAAEITAALPDTPQVQSGMCGGWIEDERVWKLPLVGHSSV